METYLVQYQKKLTILQQKLVIAVLQIVVQAWVSSTVFALFFSIQLFKESIKLFFVQLELPNDSVFYLLPDVIQHTFKCTNCTDKYIEISENINIEPNTEYILQIELMRTDTDNSNEYAEIFIDGVNIGICNPNRPVFGGTYFSCNQINHGNNVPIQAVSSKNGVIQFNAKFTDFVNDVGTCPSENVTSPAMARVRLIKGNKNIGARMHQIIVDLY